MQQQIPTAADNPLAPRGGAGDVPAGAVVRPATEPTVNVDPLALTARGPERFGRYVLLERMGVGGMAEVFRAVVPGAEGFRRQVVLKRILANHASAPAFVEMFAQEARISALLHHPNIVQVFDFGQVDGSYFLAMELIDGWEVGAINKALRAARSKMPIEVATHIAHEVLLGLAYAHTLKVQGYRPHIVHRDVSPSNIMCLRTGGVKLLDFGVASATGAGGVTGDDASEAAKPAFCGKLSYAAPEHVQGRAIDARIDLFAIGVVLWEMLVGERLFRFRSDRQTLDALLNRPIAPPSSRRPAVPAEIDRIVLKALERDPERRYQSAASMAEDLEQVLSERRYQSQMLPRLLGNLFGEDQSGPSSVTAVEELIQSGSTIPPAPLSSSAVPLAGPSQGWAPRFLGGVAAALLLLGGVFAVISQSALHGRSPLARPPAALAPRRAPMIVPLIRSQPDPAPAPVPRPAPAPAPFLASPPAAGRDLGPSGAPDEAHAPPEPPRAVPDHSRASPERRWRLPTPGKRKATNRRSSRSAPSAAVNLMAGERPIVPLAEAASRSVRR